MKLSERSQLIKPSPTLAVTAKASALKAQGIDVVDFGAGEPDFDTPVHIKEAAKKAIDAGFTKYTPATGTVELKKAIAAKFETENNLKYATDQIIVSCGAKHSLFNLFQAVLDPGDEIVIIAPYWVSYPDMGLLAGATPKFVATSAKNGFKPNPNDLAAAITKKTALVVINSPSNPTGAGIAESDLKKLAPVLESGDFWVASDEIYEKNVYEGFKPVSPASLSKRLFEKTITVNGVSKTYAMTGWRIGYAAGDKEVVKAMGNMQSQSTSNPTSIAQKAAVEALTGSQAEVGVMVAEFKKRRDWIVKALSEIPGVTCNLPEGAFYVFPDFNAYLGKKAGDKVIKDSVALSEFLLDDAKVAVVPGSAFGAEGFIRLSYATSMKNIQEGIKRIAEAVKKLK
jgi:aspartate aminotransferase